MSGLFEVEIENRSGREIDEKHLIAVAGRVLKHLSLAPGELGVALVTPQEMARLNQEHMSRQGATDVISFPLDVAEAGSLGEVPLLLGDVVICPEAAARQAEERGLAVEEEICLLLIHGLLHIAGYDHEADEGEMEEIQEELFQEFCRKG